MENQYDLIVRKAIQKCLQPMPWTREESDAMKRYLLLRKKLGRDGLPEDCRAESDEKLLDTMVIISKKFPKKEIANKMREQLKELGLGKGDF